MIDELITARRAEIARRWFERIASGYPAETAHFLRRQDDPFANTVGASLRAGADALVEALGRQAGEAEIAEALDRIVRVRAVQEMTPGQAVGIVFELRDVIRDVLADVAEAEVSEESLRELDQRIDRLALAAFDVYVACREQVFEIRVNEIRNRSLKTMERLNEWRSRRDAAGEAAVPEVG
jgi:hypothetical protein